MAAVNGKARVPVMVTSYEWARRPGQVHVPQRGYITKDAIRQSISDRHVDRNDLLKHALQA